MITILVRALNDLFDPRIRTLLFKAGIGAAGIMVLVWIGAGWALVQTTAFDTPWIEAVIDILGGAAAIVLTAMLFPAFAGVGVSLIQENIAQAIERNGTPPDQPTSTLAAMGLAIRFLVVSLGVNFLVLLALFIPPVFPFVFYGANGYLLGREYFEMAAMRRLDRDGVMALKLANRGRIFLLGIAIAFAHTLPVINLAAPVFATIVMVRAVEAWRPRRGKVG